MGKENSITSKIKNLLMISGWSDAHTNFTATSRKVSSAVSIIMQKAQKTHNNKLNEDFKTHTQSFANKLFTRIALFISLC